MNQPEIDDLRKRIEKMLSTVEIMRQACEAGEITENEFNTAITIWQQTGENLVKDNKEKNVERINKFRRLLGEKFGPKSISIYNTLMTRTKIAKESAKDLSHRLKQLLDEQRGIIPIQQMPPMQQSQTYQTQSTRVMQQQAQPMQQQVPQSQQMMTSQPIQQQQQVAYQQQQQPQQQQYQQSIPMQQQPMQQQPIQQSTLQHQVPLQQSLQHNQMYAQQQQTQPQQSIQGSGSGVVYSNQQPQLQQQQQYVSGGVQQNAPAVTSQQNLQSQQLQRQQIRPQPMQPMQQQSNQQQPLQASLPQQQLKQQQSVQYSQQVQQPGQQIAYGGQGNLSTAPAHNTQYNQSTSLQSQQTNQQTIRQTQISSQPQPQQQGTYVQSQNVQVPLTVQGRQAPQQAQGIQYSQGTTSQLPGSSVRQQNIQPTQLQQQQPTQYYQSTQNTQPNQQTYSQQLGQSSTVSQVSDSTQQNKPLVQLQQQYAMQQQPQQVQLNTMQSKPVAMQTHNLQTLQSNVQSQDLDKANAKRKREDAPMPIRTAPINLPQAIKKPKTETDEIKKPIAKPSGSLPLSAVQTQSVPNAIGASHGMPHVTNKPPLVPSSGGMNKVDSHPPGMMEDDKFGLFIAPESEKDELGLSGLTSDGEKDFLISTRQMTKDAIPVYFPPGKSYDNAPNNHRANFVIDKNQAYECAKQILLPRNMSIQEQALTSLTEEIQGHMERLLGQLIRFHAHKTQKKSRTKCVNAMNIVQEYTHTSTPYQLSTLNPSQIECSPVDSDISPALDRLQPHVTMKWGANMKHLVTLHNHEQHEYFIARKKQDEDMMWIELKNAWNKSIAALQDKAGKKPEIAEGEEWVKEEKDELEGGLSWSEIAKLHTRQTIAKESNITLPGILDLEDTTKKPLSIPYNKFMRATPVSDQGLELFPNLSSSEFNTISLEDVKFVMSTFDCCPGGIVGSVAAAKFQ